MTITDIIYQSVLQHLALGEWAEAYADATVGLRHDADLGHLHEAAGIAAYHLSDSAASLFHLESATTLVTLGVESQLLLADLYLRHDLSQAALAILKFLHEPERCPTPLLPELSKTLGRSGRYDLALDVCQRLTVLRPCFHAAWFGAAYYMGQLGHGPQQLEFPLRVAFELAPQALPYRLNLAAVLIDIGRSSEAYALIVSVPPDAVGCACQCRRFAAACDAVGDRKHATDYTNRAVNLTDGVE